MLKKFLSFTMAATLSFGLFVVLGVESHASALIQETALVQPEDISFFQSDDVNVFQSDETEGYISSESIVGEPLISSYQTTVYDGVDYSPVYEYEYYIKKYNDVKNAYNGDPQKTLEHFVKFGMGEGRQGNENFDVLAYAAGYSDLRKAFNNKWKMYYIHYLNNGIFENRITTGSHKLTSFEHQVGGYDLSTIYDFNFYTEKYKDIKNVFGYDDAAVLKHFLTYGIKEGRAAKADYDIELYENIKPAGAQLYNVTNILFDVDFNKVYDYLYYVSHNKDVATHTGYDPVKVLKHFADYGMYEGRKGKETFDFGVLAYIKQSYAPNRFKPVYYKAERILNVIGWNLKSAYDWVDNMPYFGKNGELPVVPDNGIEWFADFGFDNYKGNCYVMAAVFYEMANVLGYEVRQISGMVPSSRGSMTPHSWVEIDIDGITYVVDPNFGNTSRNGFLIRYGQKGTWRYTDMQVMHL